MSVLELDRAIEQGKQNYRAKYGDAIPPQPVYITDDEAAVGPPETCPDLEGEQVTLFL